jgi:hypothetical protein
MIYDEAECRCVFTACASQIKLLLQSNDNE